MGRDAGSAGRARGREPRRLQGSATRGMAEDAFGIRVYLPRAGMPGAGVAGVRRLCDGLGGPGGQGEALRGGVDTRLHDSAQQVEERKEPQAAAQSRAADHHERTHTPERYTIMNSHVPEECGPGAVGVDVVDRRTSRLRRSDRRERFADRILTPAETVGVRSDPDPAARLWMHWAAKEAAFKCAIPGQHASPRPVFRPRGLEVALLDDEEGAVPGAPQGGRVFRVRQTGWSAAAAPSEDPALRAVVGWLGCTDAFVMAVAWTPEEVGAGAGGPVEAGYDVVTDRDPGWRGRLRPRFSAWEWKAVGSAASARARLGARALAARLLQEPEGELEVGALPGEAGRSPPALRLRGRPIGADVSLSHHGRFVAWAVRLREALRGPGGS